MTPTPHPTPDGTPLRTSATGADAALERAIARAVWTDIHWLIPQDREVTIAIRGDDIAVHLGPPLFFTTDPGAPKL